MRIIHFVIFPISLLLAGCQGEADGPPLTLCAAASLREAASEIARGWSERTKAPVRLQFEASSTLARQIQAGAPADIFISADPRWTDSVKALDRFDWVGNRLVCVVRRESARKDLAGLESLALGGEQVPAGNYAREALRKMGVALPERVVLGASVRDVLSKVSRGAAEAGIVYATDVAVDPEVKAAFEIPREFQPRIVYPVALLSPRARDLFETFRKPESMEVARRHGFTPP